MFEGDQGEFTEQWNVLWRSWHQVANCQKKDDQCQEDGRLKADFFSGFRRQKKAKKGDEEDEETWKHDVEDVEQAATTQLDDG